MGVLAKAAGSLWDWIEAGYPEEVAKRIVSGELPMDEASRMARAQEQGYGPVLYRGHEADEVPLSNEDMWMTSSPDDAYTYALARGTQYTDGSVDGVGDVTPLRTNASNLAYVRGDNKMYDRVSTNSNKLRGLQSDPASKGVHTGTDQIAEAVKTSGAYDGTHFSNIKDEFHASPSTDPSDVYNVLGSRPDVNIRHADAAYDPGYKGNSIMGGVLAGGVGLGALSQSEDADAGFITRGGKTLLEAWHGSPHKFDRFSMDQVGTGEGAQAYGHGLYFADSEDVAKQYRDQLRHRGGEDFKDVAERNGIDPSAFNGYGPHSAEARINEGASLKTIVTEAKMANRALRDTPDEQVAQTIQEYLDGKSGALYRAEIDVTPESLLDWDKPISEQSEAVRELAKYHNLERSQSGLKENTGAGLYQALGQRNAGADFDNSSLRGADRYANSILEEAGIKGIKYLDGDSRAVGNGTSNYVIFDDSLINIAERGAASVPALAATAAGTAGALAAGAKAEEQPRSAEEAGFGGWPEYKDPNAPLPVPTGWDIFDSVVDVLGMPMAGLQGLARGAYGLATGEDLVTAGANAAHMMGSEWKNGGNIMTPGWDTSEGWRRYGALTEDTFNEAGVPEPVSKGIGIFNQWAPQLVFPF